MRFSGEWKDLGTWNTLTEAMSAEVSGNALAAECESTNVINELQIPLIMLGVKNLAIAATPDGILVTDKTSSDKIKNYVSDNRSMYEKRSWGEYTVLDYSVQSGCHNSLTKHLIIKPGQRISYQKHKYRSEKWTIVDGEGKLIIDDVITCTSHPIDWVGEWFEKDGKDNPRTVMESVAAAWKFREELIAEYA